ncbi:MAG: response regulator transcription factor [Candidatus Acidiferrales bacterium]
MCIEKRTFVVVHILVADDQGMVRSAIERLISRSGEDWEICGAVDNGRAAVEAAASLKPDLVILDVRMPKLNGISAGQAIREMLPGTPVLIYTWLDPSVAEGAVRDAGLQGVVQKSDGRAILRAIRDILAGKTAFSAQTSAGEPAPQPTSRPNTSGDARPAEALSGGQTPKRRRKRPSRRPRRTA